MTSVFPLWRVVYCPVTSSFNRSMWSRLCCSFTCVLLRHGAELLCRLALHLPQWMSAHLLPQHELLSPPVAFMLPHTSSSSNVLDFSYAALADVGDFILQGNYVMLSDTADRKAQHMFWLASVRYRHYGEYRHAHYSRCLFYLSCLFFFPCNRPVCHYCFLCLCTRHQPVNSTRSNLSLLPCFC